MPVIKPDEPCVLLIEDRGIKTAKVVTPIKYGRNQLTVSNVLFIFTEDGRCVHNLTGWRAELIPMSQIEMGF